MTLHQLLDLCASRGVILQAQGDQLQVSAPVGALTPELRVQIAERKLDILFALEAERELGAIVIDDTLWDRFRALAMRHFPSADTAERLFQAFRCLGRLQCDDMSPRVRAHARYYYRKLEEVRQTWKAQAS